MKKGGREMPPAPHTRETYGNPSVQFGFTF